MNYQYQYNGVAPWNTLIIWCDQHLAGRFYFHNETITFLDVGSYAWFKLRWG